MENQEHVRADPLTEEIEKYHLDKIDEAIKAAETSEDFLFKKVFHLHSDFRKLKDLLQQARETDPSREGESKRKEHLYHLNNLLTEWQMLSKKKSCLYTPQGLAFADRLKGNLQEIKKIIRAGSDYKTPIPIAQSLSDTSDTHRWSSRYVDTSKVYGLQEKEMYMERFLVREQQSKGFKAIAIIGMTGVGKTTLCQLSFNNLKVKDHFLPRIWICMSNKREDDPDNKKEIVKRMLMCLGVEDEIINYAGEDQDQDQGLGRLLYALRHQLMGQKYLIVLDDAWNRDEFFHNLSSQETKNEKLAYGLPKGHGGTVIVTSRSKELAEKMIGEENMNVLLPFEDRNICWKIFMDSVQVSENEQQICKKLEDLKDHIVDKCAGLPLAAKMMGQIMNHSLENKKKNPQAPRS